MFAFAPKSSLVDEITEIHITHLKPLQSITLEAKLVGDKGELFESYAHYVADKGGNVDVGHDLSIGGSYSGVEPMGLIWSMKQAPGQRKGIRLMKSDVTVPYDIIVNCFDGHVIPRETSLPPFSSGTFRKSYMADGVKRVSVRKGRIRGTLFLPPGDGPFPGNCEMTFSIQLAPVVQTLDSAIHRIKIYPVDNAIGLPNTYRLDSDLSGGYRYPTFEQPGPGD